MKVYVEDAHANKQINTIAELVEDGLSDKDIFERLSEIGYKNLAATDGLWSEAHVAWIRENYSLDKTDRLLNTHEKASSAGNIESIQKVVVIDVKMPFFSMVEFMVKWVLASIPAFLLLLFFAIGVILCSKVIFS